MTRCAVKCEDNELDNAKRKTRTADDIFFYQTMTEDAPFLISFCLFDSAEFLRYQHRALVMYYQHAFSAHTNSQPQKLLTKLPKAGLKSNAREMRTWNVDQKHANCKGTNK